MAVDVSVSCCCWVAVDSEIGTLSLVQVTVVAGPPEDMQVRVPNSKSCSSDELMLGLPARLKLDALICTTLSYNTFSIWIDCYKDCHIEIS